MNILQKSIIAAFSLLMTTAAIGAADLIISYESSESTLSVTSTQAAVSIIQGGIDGAPNASHGDKILKVTWSGRNTFEWKHTGLSSFDLKGYDVILADVYITDEIFNSYNAEVGLWDLNLNPPDPWKPALHAPLTVNEWCTLEFNITDNYQENLTGLHCFKFLFVTEDNGTAYIDNIRLVTPGDFSAPAGLTATGHDSRIDLKWNALAESYGFMNDFGCGGYDIYRSVSEYGTYTKVNDITNYVNVYSDFIGENNVTYYYKVKLVSENGESGYSNAASASSYAMTDEQLLTSIQEATFRYFWDFANPHSGLAKEGYNINEPDQYWYSMSATGMGLMAIMIGAERGFVTREQAVNRVLKILEFLNSAERVHGAFPHWVDGWSGAINKTDGLHDGADLQETAILVQGMLTIKQYFDSPTNTNEVQIRNLVDSLYGGIDWTYFLRENNNLYWHCSSDPENEWKLYDEIGVDLNECMIVHILAIAAQNNAIPANCYYDGWCDNITYTYDDDASPELPFYSYKKYAGRREISLFWTHWSYLGFDIRHLIDKHANYFHQFRNVALMQHEFCVENPYNYRSYSGESWGFTASYQPPSLGDDYKAAHIVDNNGTIAPTAAISSMPYTPTESIAALKNFYYTYGDRLWGPFGFKESFNLDVSGDAGEDAWFSAGNIGTNQGPIIIMIENYRTQLCWNKFMANTQITDALEDMGWIKKTDNFREAEFFTQRSNEGSENDDQNQDTASNDNAIHLGSNDNEWFSYDMFLTKNYYSARLKLRYSDDLAGNVVNVSVNDVSKGSFTTADTGSWENYVWHPTTIYLGNLNANRDDLTADIWKVKFNVTTGGSYGFHLDCFEINNATNLVLTNMTVDYNEDNFTCPGYILAEDFAVKKKNGSTNVTVKFTADNDDTNQEYIKLNSGFSVERGCIFTASVGN